jgi:hypothetical protein
LTAAAMPRASSTAPQTSAQLVDSLVACLGVYDRASEWPPRTGRAAPPRTPEGDALRRWFRRLTPAQRCDALTIHDPPWAALLLAMAAQRAREARTHICLR